MLSALAKHSRADLTLRAQGDLEVDPHHLVEDVGICLGEALRVALGEKAGIVRYGSATVPMDDAMVLCALDLSGRSYLAYGLSLKARRVESFATELVEEFFRALATSGGITLHLGQLAGRNAHHVIEAAFKAFARALDQAARKDPRVKGVPSTKGRLE
jgi:imidazoleglycerol-phosphate dehydratase